MLNGLNGLLMADWLELAFMVAASAACIAALTVFVSHCLRAVVAGAWFCMRSFALLMLVVLACVVDAGPVAVAIWRRGLILAKPGLAGLGRQVFAVRGLERQRN